MKRRIVDWKCWVTYDHEKAWEKQEAEWKRNKNKRLAMLLKFTYRISVKWSKNRKQKKKKLKYVSCRSTSHKRLKNEKKRAHHGTFRSRNAHEAGTDLGWVKKKVHRAFSPLKRKTRIFFRRFFRLSANFRPYSRAILHPHIIFFMPVISIW